MRIALDRDLGQGVDERLARVAAQPPTLVIGRHPPRDREEPRLQGACRLVGVAGTVKRHEDLLIHVLHFLRIPHATPEELHHHRADVVKQRAIGIGVPALRLGHQSRTTRPPFVAVSRTHNRVRARDGYVPREEEAAQVGQLARLRLLRGLLRGTRAARQ